MSHPAQISILPNDNPPVIVPSPLALSFYSRHFTSATTATATSTVGPVFRQSLAHRQFHFPID